MTFPPHSTMFALLGLHTGDTIGVDNGDLVLACDTVEKRVEWTMPPAVLDELEGRGWIEIGETGPTLTDAGRYWLGRWFKKTTRRELSQTRFVKRAMTGAGSGQA